MDEYEGRHCGSLTTISFSFVPACAMEDGVFLPANLLMFYYAALQPVARCDSVKNNRSEQDE
jgi:hypothetical protein